MGEPRLHPIRTTLTATTVAGVMLVAIAGCAAQPLSTKESDALAGGVRGSRGGAPTGVVVVTVPGGGKDSVVGAGPGYIGGNSLRNSDNHSTAFNDPNKSLTLSLPQRYLAF